MGQFLDLLYNFVEIWDPENLFISTSSGTFAEETKETVFKKS